MKRFFVGLLLSLSFLLVSPAQQSDPLNPSLAPTIDTNPAHYPSNLWVTDGMVKVFQNTGSPGSVKWAQPYGAKNEIVGFQIHVQAPSGGLSNFSVTMSDLVNAVTGTHISATSTDVLVYAERYICTGTITANSASFYGVTGCIPDPLVPAKDPYHHQTTNAFPINIAANKNQSVWVDVHVPPTAPSGYYSGTATVSGGGSTLATVPVVLAVWNWLMPSTSSMRTVVSTYTSASLGDFQVELLDHRYSLTRGMPTDPGSGSFSSFDAAYGGLLSGTGGTVAGILQGAKLTSWMINSSPSSGTWANYRNHFSGNGWVTPWFYLFDEPSNSGDWSNINSNGSADHALTFPVIPNLVTANIADATSNNALNNIDVMVAKINDLEPQGGPLQNLTSYQNWLAGSTARVFGSYSSCSPSGTCTNGSPGSGRTHPNYDIDGLPVANRVMEWMSFKHGQKAELYWAFDYCDSSGASVCTTPGNALTGSYAYGGNGDGTAAYNGTSAFGVSTEIWVPSVRLKLIRDGMQDYEYLVAVNATSPSTALSAVNSFITNTYTYNFNPSGLTSARATLGNYLHTQSLGGAPPARPNPPTGLAVTVN